MAKTAQLAIVSHTHWDREWYQTYQEFRLRLIDVMDELLDLLAARPEYASFLLDGQTVMLSDYLEMRPERRDTIEHFVASGRLQIGPWYVQPDEFLVSGEALVRNLALGRMDAEQFGAICRAGWLPDTFGHIAQLPQILRNFDIDSLIFMRGLGDEPVAAPGVFWLVAPNGDRVLAVHQLGGYTSGGNLGHRSFWGRVDSRVTDLSLAEKQIRRLQAMLDPDGCCGPLAIWNGADHTPAQSTLPEIITHLQSALPETRITHGTLQGFIESLGEGDESRPVVTGELRGSRYQPILSGTLSARMPLKQINAGVERTLLRYAEPLAALAWLVGAPYPAAALWKAWRLVLQNQCHDSICGCHIDRVTEQMMGRYREAQDLADSLADRGVTYMAERVQTGSCAMDSFPLLVVNTQAQQRHEVVNIRLRLPSFHPPYSMTDSQGESRDVQIISHTVRAYEGLASVLTPRELLEQGPMWCSSLADIDDLSVFTYAIERMGEELYLTIWLGDRHWHTEDMSEGLFAEISHLPQDTRICLVAYYHEVDLAFQAWSPGLGCETYVIRAGNSHARAGDQVVVGPGKLENQTLRVAVGLDGLIMLTHVATGRTYGPLGMLDDSADVGDTYDYSPLVGDGGQVRLLEAPRVETIETGPVQGALRITSTYVIPARLSAGRTSRSAETVLLPIVSTLRLKVDSPILEISVDLDNRACDHRLRLRFPTGLQSEQIYAGGQFGPVERLTAAPKAERWVQPPANLRPHSHWFGVGDENGGLAILAEGLPEHEPQVDGAGVTLALTLLRCVGRLSRADLRTRKGHAGPAIDTPDAQCLGRHSYRCGILPFAAKELTALSCMAETFIAPLYAIPTSGDVEFPASGKPLLALSPGILVLSSLTVSQDGKRLVVRFYNPLNEPLQATLSLGIAVQEVYRADAAENTLHQIEQVGGVNGYELQVGPAEIVTLMVTP